MSLVRGGPVVERDERARGDMSDINVDETDAADGDCGGDGCGEVIRLISSVATAATGR